MKAQKTCPHCRSEVRVRELPHQSLWRNYRACPNCGGFFTPDIHTKYLQAVCILVAMVSLAFTLLLYFEGERWLPPSVATYILLGIIVYWGNRRLYFVPNVKTTDS